MAQIIVAQRMWQRRDTAANWTNKNPVLAGGEIGVQLGATSADTKFKIGDGVTPWNGISYFEGRLVELGNHDELMAAEGHYYKLYQAQARNVDTEQETTRGLETPSKELNK